MSNQTQLQIRGLARDPNAFQAAQAGALRRAENVVVRSDGVAESRPNFDLKTETTSTSMRIKALREFDGALIALSVDSGDPNYWSLNEDAILAPNSTPALLQPPNYDDTETKFAEARGNLYATGIRGSFAVESGSASESRLIGVDMRLRWAPWSGGFTGVASGLRFAYVVVYVRKDSSGYIRRSPPSDRRVVDGVIAPGGTFYIPAQLVEGDQVEFYRSRASATSTSSPRPEHFLALTYTLTSADIAAGHFNPPADTVADADLGAELYTDASQGTALAAKFRPPMASLLAWWARCMWYGRTRAASRLVLTLAALFRSGVPTYWDGTGWTFTSGSPTATATLTAGLFIGMSIADDDNTAGPGVAGVFLPAGTMITNIVGTTITMSHNALSTGSKTVSGYVQSTAPDGLAAYDIICSGTIGTNAITTTYTTTVLHVGMYFTAGAFHTTIASITGPTTFTIAANLPATIVALACPVGDIITINGVQFTVSGGGGVGPTNPFSLPDMTLGRAALGVLMQNLVAAIETYALANPTWSVNAQLLGDLYKDVGHPITPRDANGLYVWPGTVGVSLLLEEGDGSGASFDTSISVTCTAPKAFTPAATLALPLTSEGVVKPNRLYFSDPDEPESVPLTNYFDIGSLDEPIQALVPLRDMLLVFKTDGIWRVTGSAPSSWSVEPVDTTLRLVRPETVCVVNGIAYAWCDRGFFAITEGGAQSLSANALDVELRVAAAFVMNQPLSHGAFVIGWHRRNLVLLGVPDGTEASACAKVYAYSLTTGAWSEWPMAWGPVCESQALDAVYYSRPADDVIDYEVRVASEDGPRGYDRSYVFTGVVTIDDPTAPTVLSLALADAGAWEPRSGDFIGCSSGGVFVYRRIVAVTLLVGIYTISIEAAIPGATGANEWRTREVAQIVIEWHPSAPATVPTGTLAREVHVQLDLRLVDQKDDVTTPRYIIGASSEHTTSPSTFDSSKPRELTIQPIRVGLSRQVARAANLAPYFETGDITPIRVLGVSVVHERTSERTMR